MSVVRTTALTAAVTVACALAAAGNAEAAAQYYGTIAVSKIRNAAVVSTDRSKVSADAAAIRDCASYDCTLVLHFTDGCGAVAQGADGTFGWAAGGSRDEAEQAAITGLGQSNPPFPDLGSASPQAAHVVASACTPNIQ
ncbi:DUF4189 domain-containing protein [Nocardia sp. NBC_01327]|uniref:DUF4189 domain-containing protein n=1 Tax=Nocardia sp. NBC_01327 TaxID=2903593 RepID=UPI002E15B4F4|nr:DUF4189 domain-containing protein [Nocardia sp. NBC_01327]